MTLFKLDRNVIFMSVPPEVPIQKYSGLLTNIVCENCW